MDTKPISEMTKDELGEYFADFGKEIDKRRKIEDLRKEAEGLSKDTGVIESVSTVKTASTHLKNALTGNVFVYTALLAARGDLLPCTVDGTLTEDE